MSPRPSAIAAQARHGAEGGVVGRRITPCRIALFDRGHRLSGHPGKGLNFSFQGDRLGGEASMLKRVPIATGSPASRAMHAADAIPSNCRRSAL
jgi:hypothetical protein